MTVKAIDQEIGEKLLQLRTQAGQILQDAANGSGLSASTICRIENGKQAITVSELLTLARYFEVPLSHFLPDDKHDDYWHQRYMKLRADVTMALAPPNKA